MYGCNAISEDVVRNLLSEKFSKSMKVGIDLYKGTTSLTALSEFYQFTPADGIRASKTLDEHGNFYNLLLNNLDSWSSYPKREKSIITTTSDRTAKSFSTISSILNRKYGGIYKIFPVHSSTLAIAPKSDIWDSFSYALNELSIRGYNKSLKDLNGCFNEILKIDNLEQVYKGDWQSLKKLFAEVKIKNIPPPKGMSSEAMSFLKTILREDDIIAYLNNLFEPKANGFVLKIFDDQLEKKDFSNNEVWLQDEALVIDIRRLSSLVDH